MAPIPKGGGKGGFKTKSGGGGTLEAGLSAGETAAVVLSCIFGPIILWIIFRHCLLPMCVKGLEAREKRRQRKLQKEAALGTNFLLVEQPPPPGAPAAFEDLLPSQTPAGGDYDAPTTRILTPIPPTAQKHHPLPYGY